MSLDFSLVLGLAPSLVSRPAPWPSPSHSHCPSPLAWPPCPAIPSPCAGLRERILLLSATRSWCSPCVRRQRFHWFALPARVGVARQCVLNVSRR